MNPSAYLLAAAVFAVPTYTIARVAASIPKSAPRVIAAYSAGPRWVARKTGLLYCAR